jgi:hypothetical protein
MQQSKNALLFLSAAVIIGSVLWLGCATVKEPAAAAGQPAAAPESKAPPAPSPQEAAQQQAAVQAAENLRLAEEAFKQEQYSRASELYTAVIQNPQGLSERQIGTAQTRLTTAQAKAAELKRTQGEAEAKAARAKTESEAKAARDKAAAEERSKKLATLLASARELVDQKKYDQVEAPVAELVQQARYLTAEQMAQLQALRQKVAEATGIMPAMSAQEKTAAGSAALKAGIAAYDKKQYIEAQKQFDLAVRLGASAGLLRWSPASWRKEVTSELESLRAAFADGKAAYEKGDYKTAQQELSRVKGSGVSLGAETDQQVNSMLAGIETKVAEQEVARLQAIAAEAPAATARAAELLKVRSSVAAAVAAAAKLMDQKDYQAARAPLVQAQELLARPGVAELPGMTQSAQEVGQKLAEVDKAIREQKGRQEAVDRVKGMFEEARKLAASDPAAAERKVDEAAALAKKQSVPLTPDQDSVRAVVMAALEAKFGRDWAARRQEYANLEAMAATYGQAGEVQKAVKVLELVKAAPAGMVSDEVRNQALAKLADVEATAKERMAVAGRVARTLDPVAKDIEDAQYQKALDAVAAAGKRVEDEKLAGPAMAEVLKKAAGLLEKDFLKAVTGLSPQVKKLVDDRLSRTRTELAGKLAKYYLDKGSYVLAEPYLRTLATGSGVSAKDAEWAKGQLASLESLKARAQQTRLLEVKDELQKVGNLAQELLNLAKEGKMDKASAVEQQLADARVELEARKAELALRRGDWAEATKLLKAAPLEGASAAVVRKRITPLNEQASKLAAADEALQQAEAELAKYSLEAAIARLDAADIGGLGAEPLTMRKDAIAGVLDAAREGQKPVAGYEAAAKAQLAEYNDKLAAIERREAAWQNYHDGLKAYLEGGGAKALLMLRRVAEAPADAGLEDFERSGARDIVSRAGEAVAVAVTPATGDAQKVLAEAQASYDAAAYVTADEELRKLQAMPAYAQDPSLKAGAERLSGLLKQTEDQAARLYGQAVAAQKAGDKALVGKLVTELRQKYSETKIYREHL